MNFKNVIEVLVKKLDSLNTDDPKFSEKQESIISSIQVMDNASMEKKGKELQLYCCAINFIEKRQFVV